MSKGEIRERIDWLCQVVEAVARVHFKIGWVLNSAVWSAHRHVNIRNFKLDVFVKFMDVILELQKFMIIH